MRLWKLVAHKPSGSCSVFHCTLHAFMLCAKLQTTGLIFQLKTKKMEVIVVQNFLFYTGRNHHFSKLSKNESKGTVIKLKLICSCSQCYYNKNSPCRYHVIQAPRQQIHAEISKQYLYSLNTTLKLLQTHNLKKKIHCDRMGMYLKMNRVALADYLHNKKYTSSVQYFSSTQQL